MKTTSQINFLQQIKFTCMKRKKFFIQFSQLNFFFSLLLIERWEDENYIVLREVAFLKEVRMCYTLCHQKKFFLGYFDWRHLFEKADEFPF